MERYSAEKGGEREKNQQTLKACLSSLNSSQGKAGKIEKSAERENLVGEKRGRFFALWLLHGPSTLPPQTSGKSREGCGNQDFSPRNQVF